MAAMFAALWYGVIPFDRKDRGSCRLIPSGSIVGVGSAKRFSAVKWGVAGRIVWAWILTIPAAGVIAALSYGVILVIEKITGAVA